MGILGNNLASVAATALATDISLKLFGDEGLAIAIGDRKSTRLNSSHT